MAEIAIVGLGTMGLRLTQVFAQAGFEVLAHDAAPQVLASAEARLRAALAPRLAKGQMSLDEALIGRIAFCPALGDLAPAELIIEAVVERLDAKVALLRAVQALAPEAILASNTSSLPVTAIAAGLARPEALIGLHFFNPAPAMKLVELIGHAGSAPKALARARAEAAGKVVIACPDRPGFIVNRVARPFHGEALILAEAGWASGTVDAALVARGYRPGPFALIDLVGADVHLAATRGLAEAMGGHPRHYVAPLLVEQVAAGRLGSKSGRGFVYPAPPEAPLPEIEPPEAAELAARIEATLVNEAAWLLEEGALLEEGGLLKGGGLTQADIDTALRLGMNLPRGPFEILAALLARREALAAAAALRPRRAPPPPRPRSPPEAHMTREVILCRMKRTPVGRYGGALAHIRPDDLAGAVSDAVLAETPGLLPDEVIFGCANQAGKYNRNVARMAVLPSGLTVEVAALTVNRLCTSGLDAVILGVRAIRDGADLVLAGGGARHGMEPLARVGRAAAGVAPRVMGIGPVAAVERFFGARGSGGRMSSSSTRPLPRRFWPAPAPRGWPMTIRASMPRVAGSASAIPWG